MLQEREMSGENGKRGNVCWGLVVVEIKLVLGVGRACPAAGARLSRRSQNAGFELESLR